MARGFSFIHCGDLHLGSPFRGIRTPDTRWQQMIAQATFRAFYQMIQIAIEKSVDAVLICGDVYDSAQHSLAAQLQYVRGLHRLVQAGIQVYVVHGNHDPLDSWDAKVPLPKGVHVFGGDEPERVVLQIDGEEVAAIYGQSYAYGDVRENLVKEFHRNESDRFSIAMLHCMVGGTSGHDSYAPCTLQDLLEANMDYWALGHIHKHGLLCEDPPIGYSGNIQGLHRKETGPRGCYYVEVGPYGSVQMEFLETAIIRWEQAELSIDGIRSVEELHGKVRVLKEQIREAVRKPTFVYLTLTGAGPLYDTLRSKEALEVWQEAWMEEERGKYSFVMIEGIINKTSVAMDVEARSKLPDIVGDFLHVFDEIETLEPKEQEKRLRTMIEEQPEWARLGQYGKAVSAERLLQAFRRAKWEGTERLLGDKRE